MKKRKTNWSYDAINDKQIENDRSTIKMNNKIKKTIYLAYEKNTNRSMQIKIKNK